jgi:hypothetical protein
MEEGELSELEDNIIGATNMAEGIGYMPIALALALIDKGTIDAGRLLDIIASLRTIREADFELRYGLLEDATFGLDQLEQFLTGLPWAQGKVVEQLQLHEASETAKSLLRKATRNPEAD